MTGRAGRSPPSPPFASIPGVESQLRSHIAICMNIGILPAQLKTIADVHADTVDAAIVRNVRTVLESVLGSNNGEIADGVIFP